MREIASVLGLLASILVAGFCLLEAVDVKSTAHLIGLAISIMVCVMVSFASGRVFQSTVTETEK